MKLTFHGHATLEIQTENHKLLVDPFITGNPLVENYDLEKFKPDYIILTHAHQDHVLDAEEIAKNTEAVIISNAEIAAYYQKKGIETHGMNTGGAFDFPFGRLVSTIAFHSSSFDDGTYGGNPNGYIFFLGDKKIYVAGDTSLTQEMKLIPELYGVMDLAVLPIGDNFTMGPKQAAKAAEFIKPKNILGYHYDTFPPIKIDKQEAKKTFEAIGFELNLLEIGESLNF